MKLPKDVKLEETTMILSQEPDCCSNEDFHELTLSTSDGGGGKFLVITTNRWSLDGKEEIEAFCKMLMQFWDENKS